MNKRQTFWSYAFLTAIVLFLARNNLLNSILNKEYLVNFGLIKTPIKLALLNANLLIFDLFSIILARSEADSLEYFLQIRGVVFLKRLVAFKKNFLEYLIPVILVHLILFNSSNWIISWEILIAFVLVWIILVGLPMYSLSNYWRLIIIFLSLIVFRILA